MASLGTDVSADADVVAGARRAGVTKGATGKPIATVRMKLEMMRGSFLPADAGVAMNAKVWSPLLEESVQEVVPRVPAGASQVRLQSVSRAWRRLLASARLRTRIAAAAQERVVARVGRCSKRRNRSVGVKPKLVDIDLASFVPSSFWSDSELHTSLRSYTVVAAANGLVCISNSNNPLRPRGVLTDRYCVLNPLTRTCKVLPPVPFLPDRWLELTPDAITIFCRVGHDVLALGILVATYDLQAASGKWDCAAYRAHVDKFRGALGVAVCARETFLFYDGRLHVLAPGPPHESLPISMLVEVGELEQPSLELLGVDASLYYGRDDECLQPLFTGLEAHRGEVFFFMRLDAKRDGEVDILMCLWRLAREQLQWEAVVRLDVADLERLTALEGLNLEGACQVWAPCGVQESLWFCVEVGGNRFFWLDFNLDTGEWQLAHDNMQRLLHGASSDESVQHEQETEPYWNYVSSRPFELRSDLFL